MAEGFKSRYINEIAGGFVLLAVFLLVAGIYLAGHAKGWFEPKLVLHTRFSTTEGTFGLQEGAEVRILGTLAGRVGQIYPVEDGSMESTMILLSRFQRFVRKDSIARVKKKYEVAGDSYVDITLGDPKTPQLETGDYIPCEKDVELIQAAQKALDDVRAKLAPIMTQVEETLENINSITHKIDVGDGTMGRLLSDRKMAENLDTAIAEIRRTGEMLTGSVYRVDGVLAELKDFATTLNVAAAPLPELSARADAILKDIRTVSAGMTGEVAGVHGVLFQAQHTLHETERLIEGLQRHWLVRGYVQPPGQTEVLDAKAIRNSGGGAP